MIDNPSSELHSTAFQLEDVNPEERTFRGMASVFDAPIEAYIPTIIQKGAFKKTIKEQGKRVKILRQHDPRLLVGIPRNLAETDDGLEITAKIVDTDLGNETLTLLREGALDEMSIGFDPLKWSIEENSKQPWLDGEPLNDTLRKISEVRLHEISLVILAAQPAALVSEVHAVVGFQNLPIGEDVPWSSAEALSTLREWAGEDWAQYRQAFVWYDRKAADQHGSYRLPIATLVDDTLTVIPRAVYAAAARLNGFDVPESEKLQIKKHLTRYYKKLNRTPPWERQSILAVTLEPLLSLPFDVESDGAESVSLQDALTPEKLGEEGLAAVRSTIDQLTTLLPPEDETADDESDGGDDPVQPTLAEMDAQLADAELQSAELQLQEITPQLEGEGV